MRYISTRGQTTPVAFTDAVLTGLAPDGGLLIPADIPDVAQHLDAWRDASFVELAKGVAGMFIDDIPAADLDVLVEQAYAEFDHPDVVPSVAVGDVQVLELFHGPTLAFKDIALQLLGRLFAYILGAGASTLTFWVPPAVTRAALRLRVSVGLPR